MINTSELIKYVEDNINEPNNITISKIANYFYIAPTTVYRMSLALGYENFTSFKIDTISKCRLYSSKELAIKESNVVNNDVVIAFIKEIARKRKVYIYDKYGVNSRLMTQMLIHKGYDVVVIYDQNMLDEKDALILSYESEINQDYAYFINLKTTENNLISLEYEVCQKPIEVSLIEVYSSVLTLLNLI